MAQLAAAGVDVFDRRCRLIEDSNPKRYTTSYDAQCEPAMPPATPR